jgi:hypothetical protein
MCALDSTSSEHGDESWQDEYVGTAQEQLWIMEVLHSHPATEMHSVR